MTDADPKRSAADPNAYPLHLTEETKRLTRSQPLSDTGAAAIAEIVGDVFTSQNGHARADIEARLTKTRSTQTILQSRKNTILAEQAATSCGNSVPRNQEVSFIVDDTGKSSEPDATGSAFSGLATRRLAAAVGCFAFAAAVSGVDWLLGYNFCRPTILNNGGTVMEAMVCGVPFATAPWGVELGMSLHSDPNKTRRTVRWCWYILIICAVLYSTSFALEFALSAEAAGSAWYIALAPFLPICRLAGQLGLGCTVAFYAIMKGMILSKMSRAEELQILLSAVDKEIADLNSTQTAIEGELSIYDATLNYYIATAQAECRDRHLNH